MFCGENTLQTSKKKKNLFGCQEPLVSQNHGGTVLCTDNNVVKTNQSSKWKKAILYFPVDVNFLKKHYSPVVCYYCFACQLLSCLYT